MAVVRDIEPWDELLAAGREDDRLVMQAAQHRREARAVALPEELHPAVTGALEARGVDRLWSHQAEALHAAWAGPTIVTTGTASGKSLCFQLPTLDTLCRDRHARALYLYPTKALAQDQARALAALGVKARPARDLRRRHAARAARADPPPGERDPHEPGHAAPRDPPEPPGVGERLRQPRGGRGRRGARLPRRVRLPRRQRAAAAAADRRGVRDRAALRARERDDREPGRARRAADGARRGDRRRPGRLAGRAQDDRDVEPARDRRAAADPPLGAGRGRRPARRARGRRARGRSSS